MEASKAIFGLPGIAIDQPDVFETPEVPKNEQRLINHALESSVVDVIKVKQVDAFKRFEKSSLIASEVDFCGRVGQRGYQTWGEWQLPEGSRIIHEDETVLEKYRRLQTEVAELKQKLQLDLSDTHIQSPLSGDLTVGLVISHLEELVTCLQSMKVEQWAESDFLGGSRQETPVLADLNKDVEKLTASTTETKDAKSKEDTKSRSCLTYELLCQPALSRSGDLTVLNQMEQKLKRVENVVGIEKTSFLNNISNERTIADAVSVLAQKVSQLDPSHLEQIDGRLTSLIQKLNQIQEGKSKLDSVERDARLVGLLQVLKETECQRLALPVIASRLNSLSELEQQGTYLRDSISPVNNVSYRL